MHECNVNMKKKQTNTNGTEGTNWEYFTTPLASILQKFQYHERQKN